MRKDSGCTIVERQRCGGAATTDVSEGRMSVYLSKIIFCDTLKAMRQWSGVEKVCNVYPKVVVETMMSSIGDVLAVAGPE